ncbi:MAG: hypothetical protein FWC11_02895, partial [Firmicutes bacterium]|nr:hypothetical protein [Bacillota bacterium]
PSRGGVTVPQTPFGPGAGNFSNTTRPFLMINTATSETAVRFDSSNIALSGNSFYRISAWVRTGNFSSGSGASIRLNGLDGNYAFTNINTINNLLTTPGSNIPNFSNDFGGNPDINRFGWRQYTFYVATAPIGYSSLTVSLGVGDFFVNEYGNNVVNRAQGYAFFDEVTAYSISSTTFNFAQAAANANGMIGRYAMVVDQTLESAFALDLESTPVVNEAAYFGFQSQNWSNISVDASRGTPSYRSIHEVVYGCPNTNLNFSAYSPLGRHRAFATHEGHLNQFLMLNTFSREQNRFLQGAIGVQSRESLTVERFSYYRLSVWVKTQDVEDGNGASIRLVSDQPDYNRIDNDNFPVWDRNLSFSIDNVIGDDANAARYHWREYAFYIQGSSFHNVQFQLEFWLGADGAESQGIAMFHNIRFDRLTFSEFTANSAGGTLVSFDAQLAENNAGVENSAFMTAGDFTERVFPLPVASWDFITPATSGTAGLSSNEEHINNEEILHGMFPLQNSFFQSVRDDFNGFPRVRVPQEMYRRNAMVLANNNRGAIGYRSPAIHVEAMGVTRISVDMLVEHVPAGDYGASLVLRHGLNVIGTIENITDTMNRFETFNFIIEGAGPSDITIEIWLGKQDRRNNNTSKLSSGVLYVNQVRVEAYQGNFIAARDTFVQLRGMNHAFRTRTYSFINEDFTAFDSFDNGFVRHPHNWQVMPWGSVGANEENRDARVHHGIFDSNRMTHEQVEISRSFRNDNAVGNGNVLMLSHSVPSSSIMMSSNSFNMLPENFYRITTSVMVDLPNHYRRDTFGNIRLDASGNPIENTDVVGGGIHLTGLDLGFTNIRSTARVDQEDIFTNPGSPNTFKTFTFYIMVGDVERNPAIALSLGGDSPLAGQRSEDVRAAGQVFLRHFHIEEINNAQFEEAQIALEDGDLDERYNIVVDLSTHLAPDIPDFEPPIGEGFQWWLIPSILFSAALLLALALVVIRRLGSYAASKKTVKVEDGVNLYDRRRLVTTTKEDGAETIAPIEADKVYSEFDDSMPTAPIEKKEKPKVVAPVATEENIETTATEEEVIEDAYTDEFED